MKFEIVMQWDNINHTLSDKFCSYKAAEKAFLKSRAIKHSSIEEYNDFMNKVVNPVYFPQPEQRYLINEVQDN
jgi:hypothetical protein